MVCLEVATDDGKSRWSCEGEGGREAALDLAGESGGNDWEGCRTATNSKNLKDSTGVSSGFHFIGVANRGYKYKRQPHPPLSSTTRPPNPTLTRLSIQSNSTVEG